MKQSPLKNILMLLLAAMIWGSAFVAQSKGMDYVGPFTFQAARSYLGGGVLLIFLLLRRGKTQNTAPDQNRTLAVGSLCTGAALFAAAMFQQAGLQYTTVGKAGFLTALYVIIVPFLALLLYHRGLPAQIWFCAGLSVAGMYLLCLSGPVGFTKGDWLMLASALGFGVQILVIDHFSPMVDPVKLACGEFLVCAVLSTGPALALEHPTVPLLGAAWQSIAYAGVLSSGVAYTLQMVAQRDCDPTVCSLVMCLESVFSALFGWVLLGQSLNGREMIGCLLMFAAIALSQIPLPALGAAPREERS